MVQTKNKTLLTIPLLMICGLFLLNPTKVHAFAPREDLLGSDKYDNVDVASWDQMGIYGKVPTPKTGNLDWTNGCMTMSYATFMRKIGERDKNWGPADAYDELKKAGHYDGSPQFPISAYQAGTKWGSWEMVGFESGGFEALKNAWNEGYGIVCWINMPAGGNHVFTVDSIEGDTMKHLDSGRAGTSMDDPGQWGKGTITGFYKFKSSDGTKFKNLARLNDVRDGSNGKGEVLSGSGQEGTTVDLDGSIGGVPGLKERNHMLRDQQIKITLPGMSGEENNLNINQQAALGSIKEDAGNKRSLLELMRIGVTFTGIMIAAYGILFLLSYVFDRNNLFFAISLLSIITFGRYSVNDSYATEKVTVAEKKYIGILETFRLVFLIELVAYILYGGFLYQVIYSIIQLISNVQK